MKDDNIFEMKIKFEGIPILKAKVKGLEAAKEAFEMVRRKFE